MIEKFECVIEDLASIILPDFLIPRLGLAKSAAVPLFPTSSQAYLMPCLFAAGMLNEKCEELEDVDDLSDEEVVEIIKVGRKFNDNAQLPVTFCPLERELMTLAPDILQKLGVRPGDRISIIRPYNFYYLCNSAVIDDYDQWRIL